MSETWTCPCGEGKKHVEVPSCMFGYFLSEACLDALQSGLPSEDIPPLNRAVRCSTCGRVREYPEVRRG